MQTHNILLVDDSEDDLMVAHFYLSSNPLYRLITANNGMSAYNIALQQNIDLILMDWEMPDMSGLQTLEEIRKSDKNKNIPVIIMTGRKTDSQDLADALDIGAVDYIRKPIQTNELHARIRSVFNLRECQQQVLNQQREIYEQEIKIKQIEIKEKTIHLAHFSHFIQDIISSLAELSKNDTAGLSKEINNLKTKIEHVLQTEFVNEIEIQLDVLHADFYARLTNRFSNITPNERKLCALLKMNLSTKQIANITFQNINSIDVARYRLRQKLSIPKDENIVNFLLSI